MIFMSGHRKSLYFPGLGVRFENGVYETSDVDLARKLSKVCELTYDANEFENLVNPKVVKNPKEAKKEGVSTNGNRKIGTSKRK